MESDQKRGAKYTRAKHGGAAAILLIKNEKKKNHHDKKNFRQLCVQCVYNILCLKCRCVRHKESACYVGNVCVQCVYNVFD